MSVELIKINWENTSGFELQVFIIGCMRKICVRHFFSAAVSRTGGIDKFMALGIC